MCIQRADQAAASRDTSRSLGKQRFEQPHKLLPPVARLFQEFRKLDLVGFNGVASSAEVTPRLFVLDEQPVDFAIECQTPAVLVDTFRALIKRPSKQGHGILLALRKPNTTSVAGLECKVKELWSILGHRVNDPVENPGIGDRQLRQRGCNAPEGKGAEKLRSQ
jgi:hypothetical protein